MKYILFTQAKKIICTICDIEQNEITFHTFSYSPRTLEYISLAA